MRTPSVSIAIFFQFLFHSLYIEAQNIELFPVMDNTIFSEADSSNGAGIYLFSGKTAVSTERRALLKFDFSEIQANDSIISAELQLYVSRTITDDQTVTLHRLTSGWGESSSDAPQEEGGGATAQPDDATWNYAYFNTSPWNTPGGDYLESPSAESVIKRIGPYVWSGTSMLDDIREWIYNPEQNYGWILINQGGSKSAKRFNSRENVLNPPKLIVQYLIASAAKTISHDNLVVYPNPTHGLINIKGLSPDDLKHLRIIDSSGRELKQLKIMDSMNQDLIQLALPAKGLYFISVNSEFFSKVIVL